MANDSLTPQEFLALQAGVSDVQGSVFINSANSYSGADIKIVVHVYDGGKSAQEQIDRAANQVDVEQRELGLLESQRLNLQTIVVEKIEANQPIDAELAKITALNAQIDSLNRSIQASATNIDRLVKDKPKFSTKVLAEIQTLSVQTHREKFPVRALGSVYPKAFTRGPRTIAGSMIFTVFDRNVLTEFLESHPSDFDAHLPATTALIDQLPPFDITIAFANELGQTSRMAIYGCEFVNEGQTMSIEDLLLENVVQYVARDIDPMRSVSRRRIDENNRLTQDKIATTASSLLNDPVYKKFKNQQSSFDRFTTRRDPFI